MMQMRQVIKLLLLRTQFLFFKKNTKKTCKRMLSSGSLEANKSFGRRFVNIKNGKFER
ncbi:hypothetical protein DOY81_011013 [Sarcophaga bullata]|nr:hypothetical protein DOY81_011013 [Sarcophaga bullata]